MRAGEREIARREPGPSDDSDRRREIGQGTTNATAATGRWAARLGESARVPAAVLMAFKIALRHHHYLDYYCRLGPGTCVVPQRPAPGCAAACASMPRPPERARALSAGPSPGYLFRVSESTQDSLGAVGRSWRERMRICSNSSPGTRLAPSAGRPVSGARRGEGFAPGQSAIKTAWRPEAPGIRVGQGSTRVPVEARDGDAKCRPMPPRASANPARHTQGIVWLCIEQS